MSRVKPEWIDSAGLPAGKRLASDGAGAGEWVDVVEDFHNIESNPESSTTLVAYQQKARLTFTPNAPGDYEIVFSCLMSCSDPSVLMKTRVQVDDTTTKKEIIDELSGGYKYSDGVWVTYVGHFVINLTSASHDIDLDFCSGTVDKTVYIKEAVITARRITIPDSSYAEDNGESSTTLTAYQQKLRLTHTPAISGNYEVAFSCLVSCSDTGVLMKSRVQIDDTTTKKEIIDEVPGAVVYPNLWMPYNGHFVINLTAASHDIDLDFSSGTGGKTMYIKEAVMVLRRM